MTDLEKALDEKRAPWTEIDFRSKDFWVFRDAYPVTEGHLIVNTPVANETLSPNLIVAVVADAKAKVPAPVNL